MNAIGWQGRGLSGQCCSLPASVHSGPSRRPATCSLTPFLKLVPLAALEANEKAALLARVPHGLAGPSGLLGGPAVTPTALGTAFT